MSGIAVGIDLGTTYSCVAVWKDGRVEIIPNEQGQRTTPSSVTFQGKERYVGIPPTEMKNTVFDAKRLIGRKFSDPVVQADMQHWPFQVVKGDDDDDDDSPLIKVQGKTYTPEDISSIIISHMKSIAELHLGQKIDNVVITVPAHFNDSQRQATKDAGQIAGLNVLQIINEPTAAAFAYGLNVGTTSNQDNNSSSSVVVDDEKKVLVFDLGGGTFDVSVLTIEDGLFDVRATAGDTHLGGDDFDMRLVEHCLKEMERKKLKPPRDTSELRAACENAKRTLASSTQAKIQIEIGEGDMCFSCTVSRAKFDNLCMDLFQKCLDTVEQVLAEANMTRRQIDEVVLVGGSTRIPKIQSMLSKWFGNNKQLCKSVNPDEAIAYGAAVQAALLSGNAMPKTEQLYSLLLLDVAPHSLGIEVAGGKMSRFIKKNAKIPAKKTRGFTTFADHQPNLLIQVYEGDEVLTKNNNLLGKFNLDGIPPMPKGEPKIDVTFEVDVDGVLQVSAKETSTGKVMAITIAKGRLSDQELREAQRAFQKPRAVNKPVKGRVPVAPTVIPPPSMRNNNNSKKPKMARPIRSPDRKPATPSVTYTVAGHKVGGSHHSTTTTAAAAASGNGKENNQQQQKQQQQKKKVKHWWELWA